MKYIFKKPVVVFILLIFCSNTIFCAPLTNTVTQNKRDSFKTDSYIDDLFAEVNATELSLEEAETIEGDGVVGMIIGGIIGVGVGIYQAIDKSYSPEETFVTIACLGFLGMWAGFYF